MRTAIPSLALIAWSAALAVLPCAASPAAAQAPAVDQGGEDASAVIYRMTREHKEDIGLNTRAIRVLAHYSRTKFFVASGVPRGLAPAAVPAFRVASIHAAATQEAA